MLKGSVFFAAVTTAALSFHAFAADPVDLTQVGREQVIRVLVVTGGHPFDHTEFFQMFDGQPDIVWTEAELPAATAYFAPDKAGEYDVMLWYGFNQPIGEPDQRNVLNLLEMGKPLLVLHHGISIFPEWSEAEKIIGGRYVLKPETGHPGSTFKHDQRIGVKIADRGHPITRFMDDFEMLGETYGNMPLQEGLTPLLTTDHPDSVPLLGWTHKYRNSDVVYLEPGHGPSEFRDANVRRLVLQSIRWLAGALPDPSEEGFTPLFNGRDLEGWKIKGNPEGFQVKDGIIRSESGKGGNWMHTPRTYDNFILRVQWRVGMGGNSGIFVRAEEEGYPWVTGSEVQISNEYRDAAHCTGSLYGLAAVDPRPDERADVWHETEVHCDGYRMKVFCDSVPVIDVDGRHVPNLAGRSLAGVIGLQDSHNREGYVEFRKIQIKELPMSKGGANLWRLGTQAYTFHKFTLFEAVDKARALGLNYIELFPGQALSPAQPDVRFDHNASPELRDQVRRKLAETGIKLVNYGVVNFSAAEAEKVFAFARDMGIETLVSEPANTPEMWNTIDRLTQQYAVNLAVHNHPKPSIYWNPQTVLDAVKDRNPRIGACADTGHWMRSGINPIEALRLLEGRIISSHLKDLTEFGNPGAHDTVWGTGQADMKAILSELHRQEFSGVFSIEYEYNWLNSMPEIAQCIEYFHGMTRELMDSEPDQEFHLAVMTYTFNRFTLFEAIEKSKQTGAKYVEAFAWQNVSPNHGDVKFDPALPEAIRQDVKKKLQSAGLELVGYYSNDLNDKAAARRTFAFCRDMGIQYVVSEPDPGNLPLLDKLAQEHRVKLAIHNHAKNPNRPEYIYWDPPKVMKALEGTSRWVGTCADTGHWVRSGLDPVESIRKYQGRLVSVHLKDVDKVGPGAKDVPYGTGVVSMKDLLAAVKSIGFSGVFSIEYESNMENNLADVTQCVDYFSKAKRELGVK